MDMEAMFSEENLKRSAEALKRFVDGEPKNIDPLKEIPEPLMRLYGVNENYFEEKYFENEKELISYCQNNNISLNDTYILDFLGNVAGCCDVIRKSYRNGSSMLYTVVNRDGYGIYNHKRSVHRGEFVWEFNHGSIKEMYSPFRDRGIVFEEDIYAKIAESDQKIMKMVRENNLFSSGKK